jgi:hypothetical protein
MTLVGDTANTTQQMASATAKQVSELPSGDLTYSHVESTVARTVSVKYTFAGQGEPRKFPLDNDE